MNGSPYSSAAAAPRCSGTATPEVEYWMRLAIVAPRADGASIQPSRRPVIAQFFDSV